MFRQIGGLMDLKYFKLVNRMEKFSVYLDEENTTQFLGPVTQGLGSAVLSNPAPPS